MRPAKLAVVPALLLLAATSCSRAAHEEAPEAQAPKTEAVAVTGSRDASPLTQGAAVAGPFDARFIDAMIPHHESGVAMAQEAVEKAERPEIRSLAQDIVKNQSAEIDTLRTWREAWYPGLMPTGSGAMVQLENVTDAPASATSMPAMAHDAAPATPGSSMSHAAPSTLKGAEFDRDFLDRMIPHHLQAVDMSQQAQAQAEHQELRDLAAKIVQAQEAEIALMRQWRAEPAAQVSRTEED